MPLLGLTTSIEGSAVGNDIKDHKSLSHHGNEVKCLVPLQGLLTVTDGSEETAQPEFALGKDLI